MKSVEMCYPTRQSLVEYLGKHDVERIEKTFGMIEATSFERHCCWRDRAPEAKSADRLPVDSWESDPMGIFLTVGYFYRKPVTVSIFFTTINGKQIMFWDSPSRVRHSDITDKFFDTFLPNVKKTDANNFTNMICDINFANLGEK